MTNARDTIYALATAPGKAGVAVVRISGPDAPRVLTDLAGDPPPPRMMSLRRIVDSGELIDRALVVRFRAGASFTGEELAELHLHGGRAVVERLLGALSSRGLRLAEPGEFTRRAFEAGSLDLTQVEALADLIDAETETQRRQAVAVAEGALSTIVADLKQEAQGALALMEASIDFADEEDAPEDVSAPVDAALRRITVRLKEMLEGAEIARDVREGFRVALIGPPNVGKSSLINALTKSETSIVSPYAGTTRDVMSRQTNVGGLAVTFLDTAGIRDATDPVERIGVERARSSAIEAHLRIHMRSVDTIDEAQEDLLRSGDIRVWAKADLSDGPGDLSISVHDDVSIERLRDMVLACLIDETPPATLVAHRRQAERLEHALAHVKQAEAMEETELRAHHLREALRELSGLIGEVDIEDVLGDIFSRFCIGK
ncbi:MAG: tRNA uridine-5-carboxymethylaminomethyl(34) synthesis GTPase MnmE [Pseudomonadota bacterium]